MKQELADEALEGKWKELNMGIDQWKHKYLYPFGNIAPIDIKSVETTQASTQETSRMQQNSLWEEGTVNKSQFSPRDDIQKP